MGMRARTVATSTATLVLLTVALGLGGSRALAQSTGVCRPGNLLAGKRPIRWQEVGGSLAAITDETAAVEGAIWNAPLAAILDTGAATVTYDLGEITPIRALYVQADANDT